MTFQKTIVTNENVGQIYHKKSTNDYNRVTVVRVWSTSNIWELLTLSFYLVILRTAIPQITYISKPIPMSLNILPHKIRPDIHNNYLILHFLETHQILLLFVLQNITWKCLFFFLLISSKYNNATWQSILLNSSTMDFKMQIGVSEWEDQ